jgi:hypothetical protein
MLRRKVIMMTYIGKKFQNTFHKLLKEDANKQLYLYKPELGDQQRM